MRLQGRMNCDLDTLQSLSLFVLYYYHMPTVKKKNQELKAVSPCVCDEIPLICAAGQDIARGKGLALQEIASGKGLTFS